MEWKETSCWIFQNIRLCGSCYIPDQRRSKLDDKSKKCVLLGVSEESKAWRLYDPLLKRIVVSRDVVFEEEKSWDWGRSNEEIKKDELEWGDEEEEHTEEEANAERQEEAEMQNEEEVAEAAIVSSQRSGGAEVARRSNAEAGVQAELRSVQNTRTRRAPGWMADYELGEGEEKDENTTMMIMMVAEGCDPVFFDEATKQKIRKDVMTSEIESIEKNQTWELTTLPK